MGKLYEQMFNPVWKIYARDEDDFTTSRLPTHILGGPIPYLSDKLPIEIAILLPNRGSEVKWIEDLPSLPIASHNLCVGVFMSDPFQRPENTAGLLKSASIRWVANLPTICQHDDEFSDQISEVGLGVEFELRRLSRFLEMGFNCIACVATQSDAELAVDLGFKTIFILPKVGTFESGFPSHMARSKIVGNVSGLTDARVLTLAKSSETHSASLWPKEAHGVVEQASLLCAQQS